MFRPARIPLQGNEDVSVESLIQHYGALGVFLGAGIEGETVVVLGGVMAHRQLLPFWAVALAASLGSFIADQLFFFAGRYARSSRTVEGILAKPAVASVQRLLERHPTGFVFAFRFIYGMRTISPIAIGTTQIATAKFMTLNALAAMVWGPLFTAIGYFFGQGVEQLFGRLSLPHHLLVAALVPCGLLLVLGFLYRSRLAKLVLGLTGGPG